MNTASGNLLSENIDAILARATTKDANFLATISHEIRTPLNGIIGVIDLMSRRSTCDDDELYLKTLEESCRVLMSVVNRCQDISYLQKDPNLSASIAFDLSAVVTGVSQALQYFNAQSKESTQLSIRLDPRIPRSVDGDLTKIQQTLTNLCIIAGNVGDGYMTIDLTLRYLCAQDCIIHVTVKSSPVTSDHFLDLGDGRLLTLTNTDLFDHGSSRSMDISINICRKFVEELGSQLVIKRKDRALLFEFDLQVVVREKLARRPGRAASGATDVRVLVVDDNGVNRLIVTRMLNHLGISFETSGNGKEALEVLATRDINMIFMDLEMPVMDGYATTEYIRGILKSDISIIALTANSTNEAKLKCKAVGMNDYFTKPVTIQTLGEMIEKWRP